MCFARPLTLWARDLDRDVARKAPLGGVLRPRKSLTHQMHRSLPLAHELNIERDLWRSPRRKTRCGGSSPSGISIPDAEAAHEVSGHAEDTDIFPNGIFGDRSV
jgi:hypothetical protein